MMKVCKHCECEFNPNSWIKKKVGGYINECSDCVVELKTEKSVRYRGVVSGSGKMSAISIVKFDSEEDAERYVRSFNSCGAFGIRKTNSCNSIKHSHIGTNIGNDNHKGKK